MSDKQTCQTPQSVFTLPDLQFNKNNVNEFFDRKTVPFGLPLFELGVKLTYCKDLSTSLDVCFDEDADNFIIGHKHAMGCLNLLCNRLILISQLFKHGVYCCEGQVQAISLDNYTGPVFNIRNNCRSLEEHFNRPNRLKDLPLKAVVSSIENCISLLECVLFCGGEEEDQNHFSGGGGLAVYHCISLVCEQLSMTSKAVDEAKEQSIWVEKVA